MHRGSRTAKAAETREDPAKWALFLDLAGPLCLSDADGNDLTPNSRKAQGLLALIGTSPCLRRSRIWLQDKLWSDGGPQQSAACLRQCLLRIRASLGKRADCLKAEKGWISLDSNRVSVRTEPQRSDLGGQVEFLEGLDVCDPEFEDWLRDQRVFYGERWNRGAVASFEEQTGASRPALARHSAPHASFARSGPSATGFAAQGNAKRDYPADALNAIVLRLVARSLLGCAVELIEADEPAYRAICALADSAADTAGLGYEQRQEAARLVLETLRTLFEGRDVGPLQPGLRARNPSPTVVSNSCHPAFSQRRVA